MSNEKIYDVREHVKQALITQESYDKLYQLSIQDPDKFWGQQANELVTWIQPWEKVLSGGFEQVDMRWFSGAKLNVSYNCLDRHLATRAQQTAIIWEGDNPNESLHITYAELHEKVCRFANVLKQLDVKRGDRVCIYMPMIPEVVVAMLACARIGAIHSVVFGGFSSDSLKNRIMDADCRVVITADESVRGGKTVPLKVNTDLALKVCAQVKHVVVVKRTGNTVPWNEARDIDYHQAMSAVTADCPPEVMAAEDPLFVLYTSGSTGRPKGVLHTTGGYLVYAATTFKYVFNYLEGDVHWCTADVGWITGHSYIVYGPLANGATTLMYEGMPNYPDFSRFWQIIDKHQVNIFYTAPTAIRALRKEGDAFVKATKRSSLKLLGTVGEPINPEVWEWYYKTVGEGHCPILDTWWQTETGGILISPLPGATKLKPGSATKPFFGVSAAVVDDNGKVVTNNQQGHLVITQPWPGLAKTIYGNHPRFVNGYFKKFPGCYYTADSAHQDSDGYFWISGREDDIIMVSGHRLGTAEVENAILRKIEVSEAAVVGVPHPIKGQAIYAYVTLRSGLKPNDELRRELIQTVRDTIGPIATPDMIQWAPALPKTRSGKIMRRILRNIAMDDLDSLGDVSTLADPGVVDQLIDARAKMMS